MMNRGLSSKCRLRLIEDSLDLIQQDQKRGSGIPQIWVQRDVRGFRQISSTKSTRQPVCKYETHISMVCLRLVCCLLLQLQNVLRRNAETSKSGSFIQTDAPRAKACLRNTPVITNNVWLLFKSFLVCKDLRVCNIATILQNNLSRPGKWRRNWTHMPCLS